MPGAFFSDFLKGAALPSLLAALLLYLTGGIREPMRARVQALLIAGCVSLGLYFISPRPHFPPLNAIDGLTTAVWVLALAVCLRPKPVGSGYGLRALCVVLLGALLLWPVHSSLRGSVNTRNLLAFFFLGLGTWSIVERSVKTVDRPALVALPMISVGALSAFLFFKGGASLALLGAVLCVLLGAILAVSVVTPQKVSEAAILPFVSVLVVGLMAAGHFVLHVNPWVMIYLCIPFFLIWIRAWIPFVPKSGVAEAVVLGLIALIPLGLLLRNVVQVPG